MGSRLETRGSKLMRLFVALDLDDAIRVRISRFLEGVRGFAPEARWVRPESLHVTLKFIGETFENDLEKIRLGLETIHANAFDVNLRGHGFFPSPRAPSIFWIGVKSEALASLAATVDEKLALVGIAKEEHAFNPHITLARGASRAPRRQKGHDPKMNLRGVQEKLVTRPTPDFGTMTAREFFLYQSQPAPGGSKYTKLARFALR